MDEVLDTIAAAAPPLTPPRIAGRGTSSRAGLAFALLALATSAHADGAPPIAGEYVCEAGCRLTDAAPSVEISGATARCMNEFGGIFIGESRADGSIACFHKIGRLSPDGQRILWDSGMIWRRLPDRKD